MPSKLLGVDLDHPLVEELDPTFDPTAITHGDLRFPLADWECPHCDQIECVCGG